MTTWEVRSWKAGEEGFELLQVSGSRGVPEENAHIRATVQEDGSLLLLDITPMVARMVVEPPVR